MFLQFHLAREIPFVWRSKSFSSVTQFFSVGIAIRDILGETEKNYGAKERKPKGKE